MNIKVWKSLTLKQQAVLEWIIMFTGITDYPPTIAEIANHYGVTVNCIVGYLNALEKKGAIKRTSKVSRGIRVCI